MRFEIHTQIVDVKAEAARRIEERYPLWKQLNLIRDGETAEMAVFIDHVRARSNEIEQMSPVPHDYRDDRHWN